MDKNQANKLAQEIVDTMQAAVNDHASGRITMFELVMRMSAQWAHAQKVGVGDEVRHALWTL